MMEIADSGKFAPLPGSSHGEKAFPYIHPEVLFFTFMLVVSHSSALHNCEEPGPIYFTTSHGEHTPLRAAVRSPKAVSFQD